MPATGKLTATFGVLLALLLCAMAAGATAGEAPISAIEVSGNRRITSEAIRHQLLLKPGETYDAARANAALKALFATGQFADADIRLEGDKLVVRIVEHPVVRRVTFAGHTAFDEKALTKAAALASGQPAGRANLDSAKARLAERYREKGYAGAAIDVRIATVEDGQAQVGRADVTFVIDEGKRGQIESIAFIGNRAIASDVLADVLTTRRAGVLDFLTGSQPLDEARLEHDRGRLLRAYRARGFADVEIKPALMERDAASGNWRITFAVDEGQLYRVGDIGFDGAGSGVQESLVRPQLRVKPGDLWDADALEASIERVTAQLIENGHDRVAVAAELQRDAQRGVIGIDFVLRTGQVQTIERIEISGNARTRDHVIRRELAMNEGNAFHPLLAQRARKRLMALGLFRSVEIEPVAGRDRAHTVVAVRVVEQDSRELDWGVGYSSSEGVTGDISLTERNLLGNGQKLRLLIAGSENRRELAIGFTEPRLMGYRLSGSLDLFYRATDNRALASHQIARAGGSAGLGFEIAENWNAGVSYALSRTTLSDVGAGASAAVRQAAGFPGAASAAYTTSAVGTSLTYDTRDKTNQPMRGVYMTTTQELAGLGGDVRHLRTTAEARGYIPLGERTVLATRAMGGTITGWGGSEVRLLEMFYKGGETVRGFAPGGIGPRDTAGANRDALGGTNFIATSAELRTSLPFTPADFGLRVAVFADAGSLWGSSKSVKGTAGVVGTSAALRASTGVGLIWDSPVGPLRVDYAKPVARQAFDKTQSLRFGLMPF